MGGVRAKAERSRWMGFLWIIDPADNPRVEWAHGAGAHDLVVPGERAFVRLLAGVDGPAAEHEWQRAICDDPFTVVFARQVNVGAGRKTALAGGMPEGIAGVNPGALGDATFIGNVQVHQHPPGLLAP